MLNHRELQVLKSAIEAEFARMDECIYFEGKDELQKVYDKICAQVSPVEWMDQFAA